jgi:hypothetical protein
MILEEATIVSFKLLSLYLQENNKFYHFIHDMWFSRRDSNVVPLKYESTSYQGAKLLLVPLILALAVSNSVVMTTAPKSGTAKFLVWSAYTEELQRFSIQSFKVNNCR